MYCVISSWFLTTWEWEAYSGRDRKRFGEKSGWMKRTGEREGVGRMYKEEDSWKERKRDRSEEIVEGRKLEEERVERGGSWWIRREFVGKS